MAQECRDRDIAISKNTNTVSILFNGRTIASSTSALDLKEGSYPVVTYLPLADVDPKILVSSEKKSTCPYKGVASYYDLTDGDKKSAGAAWYYADPCPLVNKIADHVAFWGSDIEYVQSA